MGTPSDEFVQNAAQLLAQASRVACLTGAGVSAESGVPTFREAHTGLWTRFDPMELASQEGFAADPGLVWRWYVERLCMVEDAMPNAGHIALAQLESVLSQFTILTQNVDNLHERAGSQSVVHLHGSIAAFRCSGCRRPYALQAGDRNTTMPPTCPACGAYVRPDVVWFGELLPDEALENAWTKAESCDVMLVVGTSGVVYPAAQLPYLAKRAGSVIIDVNVEANPISEMADLFLQGPSGEVLPRLVKAIERIENEA
jgi:NAD-dependent deacetylase